MDSNLLRNRISLFIMILISFALIFKTHSSAQEYDQKFHIERSRKRDNLVVTWEKVAFFGFDNPDEIADCPVPEGKWVVKGGELMAIEGERNRAILLLHSVGDPVRVEFEVTNFADDQGLLGDITVLLNSAPGPGEAFFDNGYAFTTASYRNSCSAFYKKGKPIARTEYSPVESGKKNLVVLEFDRGHIRYWLNDQIILEAWDEIPQKMDSKFWIGIRTYDTKMIVDNLTIYRGKSD